MVEEKKKSKKEEGNKGEKGEYINDFFHDFPLQHAAMQRNRSTQHRDVTCAQYDTSRIRSVPFSYRKKASIWILVAYQWSRCSAFAERVIQLKYIDIDDDSTRVVVYRLRETIKSALNRPHFSLFSNTWQLYVSRSNRERSIYCFWGKEIWNERELKIFSQAVLCVTLNFLFFSFSPSIWFERDF